MLPNDIKRTSLKNPINKGKGQSDKMISEAQKKAFDQSFTGPENEAAIYEVFRYLLALHELDPEAVTIQFPHEIGEEFIRFIYPGTVLEEDFETTTEVLELSSKCMYNQKKAADFCGVSVRTLQRWNKQGLPHLKHQKQVLYDHSDLEKFMGSIGHHRGTQRVGLYGHKAKEDCWNDD